MFSTNIIRKTRATRLQKVHSASPVSSQMHDSNHLTKDLKAYTEMAVDPGRYSRAFAPPPFDSYST